MIIKLDVADLEPFFIDLYQSQCDECSDGESVFWSKLHQGFHHKPRGGPCYASVVRKKVWDYFGEEAAHLSTKSREEEHARSNRQRTKPKATRRKR